MDAESLRSLATRPVDLMTSGDPADLVAVIDPDAINREAVSEPPACRGRGPRAFDRFAREHAAGVRP
jgi:hypothetical protein